MINAAYQKLTGSPNSQLPEPGPVRFAAAAVTPLAKDDTKGEAERGTPSKGQGEASSRPDRRLRGLECMKCYRCKIREATKGYKSCAKCRESLRRYNQTPFGREKRRQVNQSPFGREAQRRYEQSEKGREVRRRYAQSPLGREAKRRYDQSEKGREAKRRAVHNYKMKKRGG
jgi:hypothetical protein